MIDYVSIGTILLAALIHASLQLSLGSLLLLYHSSLGKHIRKKTKHLVTHFISGVSLMTILVTSSLCFIIAVLSGGTLSPGWILVCSGILVALAFCAWFLYYRSGRSTELWLPRSVSRFIAFRAKVTNSNTEAFSLGLLVGFAEMPFSLILSAVAANSILVLPESWQITMIIAYSLIAISPLVILRLCIRRGQTVADIQKWRTENKLFLKFLTGTGFLVLAIFLIAFEVMGR